MQKNHLDLLRLKLVDHESEGLVTLNGLPICGFLGTRGRVRAKLCLAQPWWSTSRWYAVRGGRYVVGRPKWECGICMHLYAFVWSMGNSHKELLISTHLLCDSTGMICLRTVNFWRPKGPQAPTATRHHEGGHRPQPSCQLAPHSTTMRSAMEREFATPVFIAKCWNMLKPFETIIQVEAIFNRKM